MKPGFIDYWIIHPFWGLLDYLTFSFLRLFSIQKVSEMGSFIGNLAKKRFRQACEDTQHNLEKLMPGSSIADRQMIADDMWQNIARSLTEIAVLDKINLDIHVQEYNLDVLQQLDKTRPVVFLFPHLGNWELLAMSVINQGFNLNVMFEKVPNRFVRKLLVTSRKRIGYDLITPDYRGTKKIFRVLKTGQALGLAMDEFKENQVKAPVFEGSLTGRSNIRYAINLARHFNTPIVMGYCKRIEGVNFEITYAPPLDLNKSEYQNRTDNEIADVINAQCREWVMANLDQWYMLHRAKIGR